MRAQRGFTMVEVLFALVLGGIAMVGVIALYRASTNASSFSRHSTEATVLAQGKLEELRTQTGALLATTDCAAVSPKLLDETGKCVTGGIFTRTYSVTLNGSFFDVVVDVTWTEEGIAKTVTLRGRRNVP
jgi:prepilin-type N-terminal cleavage/methylation domain-containing protein